jgi:hypothetical protein
MLTGENAIDLVYKLDGGTEVVLASAVTPSALADAVPFKLGIRFGGDGVVDFFVDGTRIYRLELDATFPVGVSMMFITALKTGAGAAESAAFDWIRAGFQEVA